MVFIILAIGLYILGAFSYKNKLECYLGAIINLLLAIYFK